MNIIHKAYDSALLAYAHFDILLNQALDFVEKHRR